MRFKARDKTEVEITVIPLIDVLLFLLLFFILTTTFQRQASLRVDLPQAAPTADQDPEAPVEIAIDAQGRYYIDGHAVINTRDTTLMAALRAAIDQHPKAPVIVRADGQTPHQAVVTAMDIAQQLGIKRLSIATQGPEKPGARR